MSSILDRVRKVYNLSQLGDENERLVAQRLLDELLVKHNISLDELSSEITNKYEFDHNSYSEEKLLYQVIYKVLGTPNFDTYYSLTETGRKRRNRTGVNLTVSQFIEVEFLYEFYKREFNNELKYLLHAFIQKNGIFGYRDNNNEDDSSKSINNWSDEELYKISKMANLCEELVINKQIER